MSGLTREQRGTALVVAGAFFMQFLDAVVIVTALPDIARDLGVAPLEASSGITVYLLTAAVFVTTGSWASDRFGARRVFIAATLLFTAASLACAFSTTLWQFNIARAVQGMGGAVMLPVGRAIVLRGLEKSAIIDAVALITWPGLMAPILGPALGGLIATYIGWEYIFLINVPLGLLGVLLILRSAPADGELKRSPFDWVGFLLSASAMGGLIWSLEAAAQGSLPLTPASLLAALAFAIGVAAVFWLRRAPHPLLSLAPYKVPTFAYASLIGGAGFRITAGAVPFLLPLLFQFVFGMDAFEAGLLTGAYFFGSLLMKTVTTPLLRTFGFRTVIVANGLIGAAILAACALLSPELPLSIVVCVLVAAGLTRSMQFTAFSTLAFADLSRDQQGAGSTIGTMLQQVCTVLGVVMATSALSLSQAGRGGTELVLADFQVAFLAAAALALLTCLELFRISPEAGREVSGHRLLDSKG